MKLLTIIKFVESGKVWFSNPFETAIWNAQEIQIQIPFLFLFLVFDAKKYLLFFSRRQHWQEGTLPVNVYITEAGGHQVRTMSLEFQSYLGVINTWLGLGHFHCLPIELRLHFASLVPCALFDLCCVKRQWLQLQLPCRCSLCFGMCSLML